jgi:hypothetical protein
MQIRTTYLNLTGTHAETHGKQLPLSTTTCLAGKSRGDISVLSDSSTIRLRR